MLSINLVKSGHSAFLKFVNVFLLCVLVCLWYMKVVVSIGKWSEDSCFSVVQFAVVVRWAGGLSSRVKSAVVSVGALGGGV